VSTRIIQDTQDYTGKYPQSTPVGREGDQLSPEEVEQSVRIAVELAEGDSNSPDWRAMFRLARRLRRYLAGRSVLGRSFHSAVSAYCQRANQPEEEYWYAFLECWDKAKLAEGEDVVEWSLNMAKRQPAVAAPTPCEEKYALVGSVAYHLAEFRKPRPFWLPVKQIASLLNTHIRTVYRIINRLEADGVIRCVNPEYSYVDSVAREYVYTGPPPKV
jgi:hypothetical protein